MPSDGFVFTESAADDLDAIMNYISHKLCNPPAAGKLFDALFSGIENICSFPDSGALVNNEYVSSANLRFFIVNNYNVYYRVANKTIVIVRILYKRHDTLDILFN